MTPLSEESPLRRHEQPFAIVLKASRTEARLIEVDRATRFDRIDMQRVDKKISGVHARMIALRSGIALRYGAAVTSSRATISL